MNKNFIKYLVDPETGEGLELLTEESKRVDIDSGYLVSKSNRYPIVRGVPRFAGYKDKSNYSKTFGFEWNRWSQLQFDSRNVGKSMAGHTQKMWEKIVCNENKLTEGKLLIDFGCGSGRFIEIARKKGARVIGIDLSDAVEAANDNFKNDQDVLIVQGDILKPPFEKEIADGAFSIGVLHHLPDPHLGFNKIVDVVKKSGWVAVSLYGQDGYYTEPIVNFYRRFFKKLWLVFGPYPALIYSYTTVYVLGALAKVPVVKYLVYLLKTIFPFISLPDRNWSVLDTFDSITPSNQFGYTIYKVYNWFKETKKFKLIEPSNWGGASLWGVKK